MPTIDIHKLRAGDRSAFENLVQVYYAYVYRLSLRLLGQANDAEDATQETFITIHRAIKRFKGGSALSTWIYRIAYNTCLDELRRQKRRPVTHWDEAAAEYMQADPDQAPEDMIIAREDQQVIRAALAELPIEYRAVLVLREVEDLSYEEIADVLQCPVGTVRSRLARGRRRLAETLRGRVQIDVSDDVRKASAH